jgi:hypothetical protein
MLRQVMPCGPFAGRKIAADDILDVMDRSDKLDIDSKFSIAYQSDEG